MVVATDKNFAKFKKPFSLFQGSKIVVEKDWIVVIARNDNDRLATMNSVFRTIDLTCLLVSPALLGVIFDFVSDEVAAVFVAAWNIVSVVVEYALLAVIYRENPDLAVKAKENTGESEATTAKQKLSRVFESWWIYVKHPVRNAGLGLACLFMTVLGFDNITVGFCLHQCVSASVLGGLMGLSAVVGVCGSISFPVLRKRLDVTRTGCIGFVLLVLALSTCVASVWLPGSPFEGYSGRNDTAYASDDHLDDCYVDSQVSVILLLFGLITARYGLWVADISVTQIIQEGVQEQIRGTIGGVQTGINSTMDMIKFVLVIIFPDDETFGWLILASFGFIVLGLVSYSVYAAQNWTAKEEKLVVEEDGNVEADQSQTNYGALDNSEENGT